MTGACICGCGKKGQQLHHAIYAQEARRYGAERDPRNLVPVTRRCHEKHHTRTRPFDLSMLPDSVYEFAAEVMGDGPAFVYLSRRYRGGDDRLDALVSNEKEAV